VVVLMLQSGKPVMTERSAPGWYTVYRTKDQQNPVTLTTPATTQPLTTKGLQR